MGLIEDGSEIQQDVQHLSQGIYFVEVLDAKTKKQIFSSKLIKK